jgi:hypothetical protein
MNENKTVETEVKPAAKADNKKATVFLAPKSQRGKKGTVGAPAKHIAGLTKDPRRGRFTLKEIHALNGGTISMLTIINRLKGTATRKGLCETGEVTKLPETLKEAGKPGKPADLFMVTKFMDKKKSKGNKSNTPAIKTVAVETAPIVNLNTELVPTVEIEQAVPL